MWQEICLSTKLKSKTIRLYWKIYGGWKSLISSPYLWIAALLTLVMTPHWLELDDKLTRPWSQLPLQILPNILGFSMGGMAIVLAFNGSSTFKALTQGGRDNSYFIKMIAAFYHFILIQTIAILFGLICHVYSWWVLSFIGYFFMCYAILVALATASQLFNTARIANVASTLSDQQIDEANKIDDISN